MCVEALLKRAFRHMQVLVHRTRHKANRLVTGALELLFVAFCMCLSPLSGCKGEETACNFTSTERLRCKGAKGLWVITAILRGKGIMYIDAPAKHSLHPTFEWLNYQVQGERSSIHASYN
jgi:hypothetical protein